MIFSRITRSEKERLGALLEGYEAPIRQESISFLLESVELSFKRAGYTETEIHAALRRLGIIALIGVAISLLFSQPAYVLFIPLAVLYEYLQVQGRSTKRSRDFERDYTALLLSLSSSIRTGRDPLSALLECSSLFPESSEVYKELTCFRVEIQRGADHEKAIRKFGSSIDHPDLKLFRSVFRLAMQEGSSLSRSLERLARVTRQRQSFRRKIRSATAMQKLSAFGISLCAIVIMIIQIGVNPSATYEAFQHPTGARILMIGLLLIVTGIVWMLTLTRSRFA
jgi:tight adherence protein B